MLVLDPVRIRGRIIADEKVLVHNISKCDIHFLPENLVREST